MEENDQQERKRDDLIQKIEPDKSHVMWKTIMGRAVFGFYVEAVRVPFFLNDDYLQKLCDVENSVANKYGRLLVYTFIICIVGLASVYGTLGEIELRGFILSQIPFLSEFCILVLGIAVSLQVIFILDVIALSQMRGELFSTTSSEVPNMRMAHMKGSNAWLDAVTPKFTGYSSGLFHKAINLVSNFWAFCMPIVPMFAVIAVQLVCFHSISPTDYGALSGLLSYAGIGFSAISVFVFFVTLFVPMPFRFKPFVPPDLPDDVFDPDEAP